MPRGKASPAKRTSKTKKTVAKKVKKQAKVIKLKSDELIAKLQVCQDQVIKQLAKEVTEANQKLQSAKANVLKVKKKVETARKRHKELNAKNSVKKTGAARTQVNNAKKALDNANKELVAVQDSVSAAKIAVEKAKIRHKQYVAAFQEEKRALKESAKSVKVAKTVKRKTTRNTKRQVQDKVAKHQPVIEEAHVFAEPEKEQSSYVEREASYDEIDEDEEDNFNSVFNDNDILPAN